MGLRLGLGLNKLLVAYGLVAGWGLGLRLRLRLRLRLELEAIVVDHNFDNDNLIRSLKDYLLRQLLYYNLK